jgi:hypothetical protein
LRREEADNAAREGRRIVARADVRAKRPIRAKVRATAKTGSKRRIKAKPLAKPKSRSGSKGAARYLTGADLRREMSRWRKGDVFARVHQAWDRLKSTLWSDAQLATLDSDVVPHVFVVSVEQKPKRYHYSFVGAELADLHGQDYGGLYLHELRLGEVADLVSEAFDRVVKNREPVLFRGAFVTLFGDAVTADRLLLPLSTDGRRCDALLGALAVSARGAF